MANGGYAERAHDLCWALTLCAAAVRSANLLVRAIDSISRLVSIGV